MTGERKKGREKILGIPTILAVNVIILNQLK
jgi:hypothetical protein